MNKVSDKQTDFSNKLVFLPLGGTNEIGMNLNLYAYDDQWLMVDLGVTFHNDLGVEVLMPDTAFIEERRKKLVGLVLTHAHEDHIGAIPYLWPRLRCPIYATPFTAELVRRKLREAGHPGAKIVEIPLGGTVNLGPFGIEFVTITHSIPEPNVLAITTPEGVIVHTGDWKLDPAPQVGAPTDANRLQQIGDQGVLAMVCDSTNVFVEDHTGSEEEVFQNLLKVVGQIKTGRVVIACFATNLARVQTCARVAKAHGRRVALVGQSLRRIDEVSRKLGYLDEIASFLTEQEVARHNPEDLLIICTGSQGEARAALTRIANCEHPVVKLEEGDTVIYSSRMIPGNEKSISRVQNLLTRQGIDIIVDGMESIHVSGHPSREELKQMYAWVRPKIAIPVHGEARHLVAHADLAEECGVPEVFVPENGSILSLSPGTPEEIDYIPTGRLAVEGPTLVPFSDEMFRERGRLKFNGAVFVTVLVNRHGEAIEDPTLSMCGVVDEGHKAFIEKAVRKAIDQVLDSSNFGDNLSGLQEKIRIAVRKTIIQLRDKKPQTFVHVVKA